MINTNEFDQIFLKNFFREILLSKEYYQDSLLDKMVTILTKLFLRELGSGNLPNKILNEHKDVQEWLEEKIENFKMVSD